MKINIIKYTIVLFPLILAGCGSNGLDTAEKAPGLYISAEIPGAKYVLQTKADRAGVADLNEVLLNSVYYFLYPVSGSTTAKPSLYGHFSDLATETKDDGIMDTRYIPVGASIVNELFPSGTKECRAVVVANPDATLAKSLEEGPTLGELRALVVSADFTQTTKQDSFVMVYDDLVSVSGRTAGLVCEVDAKLKRLASKITVTATVKDGFQDSQYGWYVPEPSGIKVTLVNGFSRTNLAGDFSALTTADDDWCSSAETGVGTATYSSEDSEYSCSATAPFYTYPMEWEFSDKHEPYLLVEIPWRHAGDSKDNTGGTITSYYYKMMLSTKEITSNNWFDINLKLSILGSPNKVEPTQQYLYENYQVYDWNEAYESVYNNVNADIRQARFLVVPQTEFVLNNQPTWDIPFSTSHECEIVDATYTTTQLYTGTITSSAVTISSYVSTNTAAADISGLTPECSITINDGVIVFSHELRNDISLGKGNYDAVPYEFTFTIRHKDDYSFTETIKVRQYPAIYVTAEMNSHTSATGTNAGMTYDVEADVTTYYIDDSGSETAHVYTPVDDYGNKLTRMFGTVFENNSREPFPRDNSQGMTSSDGNYTYNEQRWMALIGGNPQGGGLGTNRNGNMYVITTSTAPNLRLKLVGDSKDTFSGETFVIGDPRETEVNNVDCSSTKWTATCPALYDGDTDRQMTYYYPTALTNTASKTIAPKFRIASSWGTANAMTYDNARRKCAAYQEDGYPAGRWRIPTEAEMEYIMRLSADNVIPPLFGYLSDPDTGVAYWCNNGYITADIVGTTYTFTANPGDNTLLTTRCVYDDWYWENTDSYVTNASRTTTGGRLQSEGTDPDYQTFVWGDMPR